jgi:glucose-1-phosphate cytidylyltransferase
MNIYANQGHSEFIIALGYKGEIIKSYFLPYYYLRKNFSLNLSNGNIKVHDGEQEDWLLHLIDTGFDTQTGGRLKQLAPLIGQETFMMTYGDGVANINLKALLNFHCQHGKLATITAVRPPARFGGLNLMGDLVTEFTEKPQLGEGWINGGFFILEPSVLDYIDDNETLFEREPLERLAADRQLVAFRHDSFWQCMDTLRDVRLLNQLWETGNAPWKSW